MCVCVFANMPFSTFNPRFESPTTGAGVFQHVSQHSFSHSSHPSKTIGRIGIKDASNFWINIIQLCSLVQQRQSRTTKNQHEIRDCIRRRFGCQRRCTLASCRQGRPNHIVGERQHWHRSIQIRVSVWITWTIYFVVVVCNLSLWGYWYQRNSNGFQCFFFFFCLCTNVNVLKDCEKFVVYMRN